MFLQPKSYKFQNKHDLGKVTAFAVKMQNKNTNKNSNTIPNFNYINNCLK